MSSTDPETAHARDRGPRQAMASELPSVRRVVRLAYAKYANQMERPPAPVLNDYQAEAEAGLIWVIGEPIVGVIVLIDKGDSLLIENVAVDPAAQGAGLGRALMEFAEQQAAESGQRRLTLYTHEVMTDNLAIYSRLGYREYDRRAEGSYRRVYMEKAVADPDERTASSRSPA